MIINWHGGGCYKIETSGFDLVVDPQTSPRGGRLKADLILQTKTPFPLPAEEVFSNKKIVGPGEYEIGPIKIQGVQIKLSSEEKPEEKTKSIQTAYRVLLERISFCFLGEIDNDLNEEALEDLGEIDVLFAPVNKKALNYIKIIEPKIVIPGFGDPEKLKVDLAQKTEPQEKLVLKKKDLEEEGGSHLVILKP